MVLLVFRKNVTFSGCIYLLIERIFRVWWFAERSSLWKAHGDFLMSNIFVNVTCLEVYGYLNIFGRNHFEFFLLAFGTLAFEKSFLINDLFSIMSYFFCSLFSLKVPVHYTSIFPRVPKKLLRSTCSFDTSRLLKALHNTTLFVLLGFLVLSIWSFRSTCTTE